MREEIKKYKRKENRKKKVAYKKKAHTVVLGAVNPQKSLNKLRFLLHFVIIPSSK